MRCPYCQNDDSKVIDTTHDSHGGIRRRRECLNCGQRFSSYERPILATPLIVKQDGTREEFDREKLERGIRICLRQTSGLCRQILNAWWGRWKPNCSGWENLKSARVLSVTW